MVAFILEIMISLMANKDKYRFSFFFWLDVISTCSLFFDISWVWDPVSEADDVDATSLTQLTRAGRGARAGTKAGRIVRIVRIIRLVRVGKLLKHTTFKKEPEHKQEDDINSDGAQTPSIKRNLKQVQLVPENKLRLRPKLSNQRP
jgi:hypothetical protein